jgi:hypothetical protein
MQLIDGQSIYSATDLVGYQACEHLAALERAALAGLVPVPNRRDHELEIIQKRGFEHEQRSLLEVHEEMRLVGAMRPAAEHTKPPTVGDEAA